MKPLFSLFVLMVLATIPAFSQNDSLAKERKNIARINVSSPMIWGTRFIAIGYERMLSENQSFSVNVGRFTLPKLMRLDENGAPINGDRTVSERGFHFAADYRFYLAKENRHKAPRGVYIGPHFQYNYLSRNNDLALNTENYQGNINFDFNFRTVITGFQLGYQFVFWERLALDMVLAGPGIGFYDLKSSLNTDLPEGVQEEFFRELNEAIKGRFPMFEGVIKPGEIANSGGFRSLSYGFRYVVNVGFRF
jgi:hypothetical protein